MFTSSTITSADTVANIMTSYGPTITIISVFLMLFVCILFFVIRNQQKANEHMIEEHKLLIENLLKLRDEDNVVVNDHGFIPSSDRNFKQHLHLQETIKTVAKISRTLKDKLEKYLHTHPITRSGVYLFHNGHYSLNGFPFFKFSCICEYVTKFSYARMKSHNQFPVNLMSDFIMKLLEDGLYSINDEKKNYTELDPIIEKMLTDKTHPFIIKGIRNTDDELIGFLICEYEKGSKIDYDLTVNEIIELIKKIAPILEFSNFNNLYKGGHENEA